MIRLSRQLPLMLQAAAGLLIAAAYPALGGEADPTQTHEQALSTTADAGSHRSTVIGGVYVWRDGADVNVRFTTTGPAVASVAGSELTPVRAEPGPLRNHRWTLSGTGERISITVADAQNQKLQTLELTVPASRWAAPSGPGQKKTVRLYLSADRDAGNTSPRIPAAVRWPVAGSVPFSRGELRGPVKAQLFDQLGQKRPVQAATGAVWPDGSIRWLLVEFAAELPGDLNGEFILEVERGESHPGIVQSTVPDTAPARLWAEVAAWENAVRSRSIVRTDVEADGPVRRTYVSEGVYGTEPAAFGWRTRVHRYTSVPFLRIEHTLRVLGGSPMARLDYLRLLFPAGKSEPITDESAGQWKPSADATLLRQVTIDESLTGKTGDPVQTTSRLNGIARAQTENGETAVIVRNFAENWPKALVTDNKVIAVELFPEIGPETYSAREEPEERLYYCFDNGTYRLRRGVEKTHEILYVPDAVGVDTEALAFWFDNPPVLRVSPERVCETGAAGDLTPVSSGTFEAYETHVSSGFDAVEQNRVRNKEYGFLNFGDWFGERGRNWGNLEYDLPHGLWLHWLRSDDYRFLRRAEQAASHLRDVDVIHADPDPAYVGRMWAHSLGHTGGYYPDGAFGMEVWSARGLLDYGHIWNQGLLNLYLATGNRRFLETGLAVADHIAKFATIGFRMGPERTAGWPIIALLGAYDVTADPYYLNGAIILAESAINSQDPETGGWMHRIGECTHQPPHYGGKPFMTGVLLTAFARLHRALLDSGADPDFAEAIRDSLLRGCGWLIERAWQEEVDGFVYAECPAFHGWPCAAAPWMTCEALGYASRISGNPRYVRIAKRALDRAIQGGFRDLGKGLAMRLHAVPHFMSQFELTEQPVAGSGH